MEFNNAAPIFKQLMEDIARLIVSGAWPPEAKVPPVRELALSYKVNPNTMQRALSELEREGVLRSERASGRYVTGDTAHIASLRRSMAQRETRGYKQAMDGMGFTMEDTLTLIREAYI